MSNERGKKLESQLDLRETPNWFNISKFTYKLNKYIFSNILIK